MNRTNGDGAARSFYSELLIPLRRANQRRDINYLDSATGQESYWREVSSRTGGLRRLSVASSGGTALLEALRSHWLEQHETMLPKLWPELVDLHQKIAAPKPAQDNPERGGLPEFVYVLY